MRYRYVSRRAEGYVAHLGRDSQARIALRLDQLCEDPYAASISKPLRGRGGERSSRVGDLRILYLIDDGVRVLAVSRIGPRGDVYRS